MNQHYVFLLETVLFEGGALAWGGWELWSLHRDKKRSERETDEIAPSSKDPARHSER